MMSYLMDPDTVWLLHTVISQADAVLPRLAAHLSRDEVSQADRYRTAGRRRAFVVGRGLIRILISRMSGSSPQDVPLSPPGAGKPVLRRGRQEQEWHFNISHAGDLLLVGITGHGAVGVDVEWQQRPISGEILLRHSFSPAERAECRQLPPHSQRGAILRGWTRKEAAWKLDGGNSRIPLANIRVSLADVPFTSVGLLPEFTPAMKMARCYTWQPAAAYIASAVVECSAVVSLRFQSTALDIQGLGDWLGPS